MVDAKRIILARRARFIAAAIAGCSPAARPVDTAGSVTIPPLADADIPSATASVADPPPPPPPAPSAAVDAGQRVVISVCLSIITPPKVTFSPNSSSISGGKQTIEMAAQTLLGNPQVNVEIEGHTDPSEQKIVGQQRADAVKAELVRRGVAQSRLATSNAGASKPIVPNDSDVNRAKNRRVEFIVH